MQNEKLLTNDLEIRLIEAQRETVWDAHMTWLKSIEFQEKSKDSTSYRNEISPRINALIEQRLIEFKKLNELYAVKKSLLSARDCQEDAQTAA